MEKFERSYKVQFKEKSYVCLNVFFYTGRGVPLVIKARTTRTNPVGELDTPSFQEAVVQSEQTHNGMLADEHPFGQDPLVGSDELIGERNNQFFQNFVVDEIFAQCVNYQPQHFRNSILFYIEKTSQLALAI